MKLLRFTILFTLCTIFFLSIAASQTATAPSAGDGTSGNPYQIAALDNLYWITQNATEWSKFYIQTANIDASSTSGWDAGSGFSPIGSNASSFTGSYDGGGYTISNLYISRSATDYIGMFGFISDATVKNLHLTGIAFSGNGNVGGLVGFSTGSGSAVILNCSSAGIISGVTSRFGGLIGSTAAGTTVTNCYSTVTVSSATGNLLGGFVGEHSQSTITTCYSKGNVSSDGDHAGGFVGSLSLGASISNCYASGNVLNFNRAGGFVGSLSSGTSISNCYSVGSATNNGGSSVGGFAALNAGTISNAFWDTDASGNATSAAGTGKTNVQMKTQSTFTDAGWDFSTVWEMVGSNYPRLLSNPDQLLPVELVLFNAIPNHSSVQLHWSTATEVNNFGFEVERKTVNQSSDKSLNPWKHIAFVEGNGTTNAAKEYFFVDNNVIEGKYTYRLKQIDRDGVFKYSSEVEATVGQMPNMFLLKQNYPNPFNPATTIDFMLSANGHTTLKIYDIPGREVAVLVNEMLEAGINYQRTFDASHLAGGVYYARLVSGSSMQTKKILLVK
ncbi:MAG: T9SS type A sorting domain-containing protein [Bacteroidota bacterium]